MRTQVTVLGMAFFLTSCFSVSNYQTARTLKKGEWNGFGGFGYQSLSYDKKSSDATTNDIQTAVESVSVPIIEGGARFGILRHFDAGLKYTTPGTLSADGKYNFWQNKKFALSTGPGLAYASVSSGDGDAKINSTILDISFRLFTSYDFSEKSAMILTPSFSVRSFNSKYSNANIGTVSSSSNIVGLSLGFNYKWFIVEYGMQKGLGANYSISQFTFGYWGGWDILDRS